MGIYSDQLTTLNANELVTVVVPAFNAAWSIGRTLASVCAQTYGNLEIVVVDDGSSDDTCKIVKSFVERDGRVKLIRQANAGVAAARNTGIHNGSGVYVAPIDSDDLWAPENVRAQVSALASRQGGASIVFAAFCSIDENDEVLGEIGAQIPAPRTDFEGLYRLNAIGNGSGAVMLRKRVIEAGGFDEGLRRRSAQGAEDWRLALRLVEKAPAIFVPKTLVGYRRTSTAMSMSPSMFRACLHMLGEVAREHPDLSYSTRLSAKATILMHFLGRNVSAGNWAVVAEVASHLIRDSRWFVEKEARAIVRHGLSMIVNGHATLPKPSGHVRELLFGGRDIFQEYGPQLGMPHETRLSARIARSAD